jgi:hypothetical protein
MEAARGISIRAIVTYGYQWSLHVLVKSMSTAAIGETKRLRRPAVRMRFVMMADTVDNQKGMTGGGCDMVQLFARDFFCRGTVKPG